MELVIKHDREQELFYVDINESKSYLKYRIQDSTIMDFIFTFVEPSMRGQGIAAKLVEAGIKYAREKNYKILATCSYVDYYFQENRQYDDLLV